jgi:hypothetical protein
VTLHQADRTTSPSADRSPEKPFIGVLPFSRYVCEFILQEVSEGQWIIRHRDSSERAYLSASYRDRHSFELVWRTSTTLCDGAAEFKNVVTAERFVATMLRRNAGRKHHGGEPRSCFALSEIWCGMKCDIRRHIGCVSYLLTSITISPLTRAATRLSHCVHRAISWAIKREFKLNQNVTRPHSRK